jgi:hypothetical protein
MQLISILNVEEESLAREKGLNPPIVKVLLSDQLVGDSSFFVGSDGNGWALVGPEHRGWKVALLDAATSPSTLEESLGKVDQAGEAARRALVERLRVIDPDLRDIRAVKGETWVPHAIYENRSLPLAVVGDGMKRLFHVAAELAVMGKGLALIEEPECFQHPGALAELVRVLWSAIEGGTQIIMSTHSIELFDLLCEEAKKHDQGLERFGVFRTALREGQLRAVRVPGADAIAMRENLAEDLRR